MAIIEITYTDEDVREMAELAGVPLDEAMSRVEEWAKHIASTAMGLIAEQLYAVIETGQP